MKYWMLAAVRECDCGFYIGADARQKRRAFTRMWMLLETKYDEFHMMWRFWIFLHEVRDDERISDYCIIFNRLTRIHMDFGVVKRFAPLTIMNRIGNDDHTYQSYRKIDVQYRQLLLKHIENVPTIYKYQNRPRRSEYSIKFRFLRGTLSIALSENYLTFSG